MNNQSFKTWFEPIRPIKLNEGVLTIQVPSQFFYEWLEEHYVNLLHKTIKRELGQNARLEYSIVVENGSTNGRSPYTVNMPATGIKTRNPEVSASINIGSSPRNPFVVPGLKKRNIESQLNPNSTFDSYIEGECNRLARSAGMAVAKRPGGTSFNPLLVYSAVGLGKSHLLQAIGNSISAAHPDLVVLYVQSEKFMNQFIDAVKNNSVNDFANFYQSIDCLIMDDVQFFSNKERIQDMFFHIFNHLHQSGKQLILSSDKAPKDLKGMEERLLSRFKWGLSADLQLPDFETRVAILERKMYADGIELPKEVVDFVAHNITTNVRELEGALISLLAHASLTRKMVDLDLAKSVIKNFVKQVSLELNIDSIQNMVAEYFKVDILDLKGQTRKRDVVQARQISMYFAKKYTKNSLKSIGDFFGGRDHATVIHSCRTVENLMETDRKFKVFVEDIQRKIKISSV